MEEIYPARPVQVPAVGLWRNDLRNALAGRVNAALLVAMLDAGRRPGAGLKVADILTPVVVELLEDPAILEAAQVLAADGGKDATKGRVPAEVDCCREQPFCIHSPQP